MFGTGACKKLCAIALLFIMCAGPVVARDLFELDLGFSGVYAGSSLDTADEFFEDMVSGGNWLLGVEVGMRLALFNVTALAIPGDDSSNGLALLSSAGVSFPIVTDFAYLGFGAGLHTDFEFPETGESKVNGRLVSETDFTQVVNESPIHFRAAVDFLFGKANLGFAYYWESQADFTGLNSKGGWAKLFQPNGPAHLGVVLRLALF
jgi:opacity protein-like surface antigen